VTSFDNETDVSSCVLTDRWCESGVVVSCAGVLDMLTAQHFEDHLGLVLDRQPAILIIDLSNVDFLASHGMNVLVMVRRRIAADVAFAVVADGPATSRPLQLIGLDQVVNMCSSLDEAYQKVGIATAH
jgi:anti-sigma B factor antagonist